MTLSALLCFLGASMALTIAPGPDNLFVITQGITRGRRAAIITALGMCSGISIHTMAAALGLSALFYSSTAAFNLVKYAGAAYLLYLAIRTVRNRSACALAATVELPAATLFRRGFVMNVLNPKVALFFLAFLPQFISPGVAGFTLQMLLLGGLFMLQAVIIFSLLGWFSGSVGKLVLSRPGLARRFDWLTAAVFTALGLRLALAER
jgi:threonine/homoserine/homoserine lactone efflux protein